MIPRGLISIKKHDKEVPRLYEEVGRLTTQLSRLIKKTGLKPTRAERLALVEAPGDLSVATPCALLSLNRTSQYDVPVPISAEEVAIKHRIDAWVYRASLLWIPPHQRRS